MARLTKITGAVALKSAPKKVHTDLSNIYSTSLSGAKVTAHIDLSNTKFQDDVWTDLQGQFGAGEWFATVLETIDRREYPLDNFIYFGVNALSDAPFLIYDTLDTAAIRKKLLAEEKNKKTYQKRLHNVTDFEYSLQSTVAFKSTALTENQTSLVNRLLRAKENDVRLTPQLAFLATLCRDGRGNFNAVAGYNLQNAQMNYGSILHHRREIMKLDIPHLY